MKRVEGLPAYSIIEIERRGRLSAPLTYWRATSRLRAVNCNGCGVAGWKGAIVPDSIYGLCVSEACNIHDWQYAEGVTELDKVMADCMFLDNMLTLVTRAASESWLGKLLVPFRWYRAFHVYSAVREAGDEPFHAARLVTL